MNVSKCIITRLIISMTKKLDADWLGSVSYFIHCAAVQLMFYQNKQNGGKLFKTHERNCPRGT